MPSKPRTTRAKAASKAETQAKDHQTELLPAIEQPGNLVPDVLKGERYVPVSVPSGRAPRSEQDIPAFRTDPTARLIVGVWNGMDKYSCSVCPFESVDQFASAEHLDAHGRTGEIHQNREAQPVPAAAYDHQPA